MWGLSLLGIVRAALIGFIVLLLNARLLDPTMRRGRLQPTPHENPVGVALGVPPECGAALFDGRFSGSFPEVEIEGCELVSGPFAFLLFRRSLLNGKHESPATRPGAPAHDKCVRRVPAYKWGVSRIVAHTLPNLSTRTTVLGACVIDSQNVGRVILWRVAGEMAGWLRAFAERLSISATGRTTQSCLCLESRLALF